MIGALPVPRPRRGRRRAAVLWKRGAVQLVVLGSSARAAQDLFTTLGCTITAMNGTPTGLREELANTLTHGLGLLLSIVGVPGLIVMASRHGDAWHVVSCSVYGATLIILYSASTLYHGARTPRWKKILQVMDHACIYLLIAGTYTPFTLVMLRGGWGWTLFGLVWGGALVGIFFKLFFTRRFEVVSTVTYILMGWIALVATYPIVQQFPLGCILWLVAGGVSYTFGVIFFVLDRLPFMHAVWHVCVLAGSICHYVAVMRYVLPSPAWV